MTEAQAKQAVKDFSPSNAQKKKARENALDKNVNTSKGSIIIKLQLCGKYCGTCPHGPYAWHVYDGNWTYLGAVGSGIGTTNVGKTSETEESEKTESSTESISLAPQISGELDGDTLEVELGPTGNKKTVAKINGTSEQYGLDREWVTEYGEKSGIVELEEGDIIESTRYTHTGKNKTRNYLKYTNGKLVKISEDNAKTAAKKKESTPVRQAKRKKQHQKRQRRESVRNVSSGEKLTIKTKERTLNLTKRNSNEYEADDGTVWVIEDNDFEYISRGREAFGIYVGTGDEEKIESVE